MAYRGIVGAAIPTLRTFELALGPDWLLIVHTDGISTRFDSDALEAARRGDPQALADAVLAGWARATDDATVVVARPRPVPPQPPDA